MSKEQEQKEIEARGVAFLLIILLALMFIGGCKKHCQLKCEKKGNIFTISKEGDCRDEGHMLNKICNKEFGL